MIVAAVDFSELSDAVIRTAADLAAAHAQELLLLHVAAPNPDLAGFDAGPSSARELRASDLHREHRRLQSEAESLRGRGVVTTALLVQGPTVEKLLAEVERHSARFLVVGSHAKGPVRTALLGSVSRELSAACPCPVVVVSPAAVAAAGDVPGGG